jgi:hypothetical protein
MKTWIAISLTALLAFGIFLLLAFSDKKEEVKQSNDVYLVQGTSILGNATYICKTCEYYTNNLMIAKNCHEPILKFDALVVITPNGCTVVEE